MKTSWWKLDEEQDIDTKYLLITEILKNLLVEKPGRQHLNQIMKISITSYELCTRRQDLRRCNSPSVFILPKIHNLNVSWRKLHTEGHSTKQQACDLPKSHGYEG